MTLREARCEFTKNLCLLVQHINSTPGYSVAFGEVERGRSQAAINALKTAGRKQLAAVITGMPLFAALTQAVLDGGDGILLTLHADGLACDLRLYKDGVWCQDAADYEPFGVWWEKLNPENAWGG